MESFRNEYQNESFTIKSAPGKTLLSVNVLRQIREGASFVPAYIIVSYFLFVSCDLGTTFLASPDLKYEGNIFVRFFNMGWKEILIFFPLHAFIICNLFLIGLRYINRYYQEHNQVFDHSFLYEVFHNRKLFLSFFFYGYFYKHLFFSLYITANNYLSYLYIHKIENSFTSLSQWYINVELSVEPYFFVILEVAFTIIAIFFTIYKGIPIRNSYRKLS
jgi:hypothetical protein